MIRAEVVVRTWWNIALQFAAVVFFMWLRWSMFGWFILYFTHSVVGPLFLLVPLVTAIATVGRGRLGWSVLAPFLATTVCIVTAAALFMESTHSPGNFPFVPVVELVSPGTELALGTEMALWSAGEAAVRAYPVAVAWLLVAVAVTHRRVRARSA